MAGGEIAEKLGPSVFGVTNDNGIGVGLGIRRNKSDMWAAQDGGDPTGAELGREFVGAWCSAGDDSQANEIGLEGCGHILDAFIDQRQLDIQFRRNESGQSGEGERLIAKRFAEDSPAMAVEGTLGRDEGNADFAGCGYDRRIIPHEARRRKGTNAPNIPHLPAPNSRGDQRDHRGGATRPDLRKFLGRGTSGGGLADDWAGDGVRGADEFGLLGDS